MEPVVAFFERYVDAWNDPARLQEFYAAPFIAARLGATKLNETRPETERFFQDVLAKYRSKGFSMARRLSFQSIPLGSNSVLATIAWAYEDQAGSTLWEWTFSYNLYVVDRRWQIVLQTLHDSQADAGL